MPKQKNYPLKKYIKAVEILAARKGFRVDSINGRGSAVRLEAFFKDKEIPDEIWTIHTEHNKAKEIYSKEDYKKPDRHLMGAKEGEFMDILRGI